MGQSTNGPHRQHRDRHGRSLYDGQTFDGRNRSLISGSKLWLPRGRTMTNICLDNLIVLRHLYDIGSTGVAKIEAPIICKISSPRAARNMVA